MSLERVDRWLALQLQELLVGLEAAARESTDPKIRDIAGRLLAVRATIEASREAKKEDNE